MFSMVTHGELLTTVVAQAVQQNDIAHPYVVHWYLRLGVVVAREPAEEGGRVLGIGVVGSGRRWRLWAVHHLHLALHITPSTTP